MADSKISGLTALSSGHATGDLIEVVDVSDTTMAGTGTNKKTTLADLCANLPAVTASAEDAGTNTVLAAATVRRTSSGTPANGIGCGLNFEVETASANVEIGASIQAVATDVTATSEDFDLLFKLMAAGASAAECLRLLSYGGIKLPPAIGNNASLQIHNWGLRKHTDNNRLGVTVDNNAFVALESGVGFLASLNHGFAFSSGNPIATTGSAAVTSWLISPAAGVMQLTNGSTGSASLMSSVLVEANTAGSGSPNLLTAIEAGTVLTNEGAAAENYHTLPTAVAGLRFSFLVQDTDGIRVTANTGDTIRIGAVVSGAAGFARCATVGAWLDLVAINATEWFAREDNGVWTVDI